MTVIRGLQSVLILAMAASCAAGCGSRDRSVSSSDGGAPARAATGVTGRVTAPDGAPVIGALVRAASLDQPARAIPEIAILTDSSGVYVWSLQPGRYEIAVDVEGHGSASGRVTVTRFARAELNLVLAP